MSITLWLFLLLSPRYFYSLPFERMRPRIAIDYGPRLIGIAISTISGSKPLCTIKNEGNLTAISREIMRIANANRASEILVGLPVDSDGRMHFDVRNFNGRLCLNFSQVLTSLVVNEQPKLKVLLTSKFYLKPTLFYSNLGHALR